MSLRALLVATFTFSWLVTTPPYSSAVSCISTFQFLDDIAMESHRSYIYETMLSSNLKIPQIGNGIDIAVLGAFLEWPIHSAALNQDPPKQLIDDQYEGMLRAHKAFGISREVPRYKLEDNARFFRDQLNWRLSNLIDYYDPDFLKKNPSIKTVEQKIDHFFFRSDPSVINTMKVVGERIRVALAAPTVAEASKLYREAPIFFEQIRPMHSHKCRR